MDDDVRKEYEKSFKESKNMTDGERETINLMSIQSRINALIKILIDEKIIDREKFRATVEQNMNEALEMLDEYQRKKDQPEDVQEENFFAPSS